MAMISSLNKSVGQAMNYTAKNWFAKSLEKGLQHPAEYAAKMMVLSIITKDAVNCAFYTYQSATNEKIPENKRGFVAALDFINGIINVGGQLLTFFLVDKFLTPKLENKLFAGVSKNPKTNVENTVNSKAPLAPDRLYEDTLKVIEEKETDLKNVLKGKNINYEQLKGSMDNIADDIIKKIGHSGSIGKDIKTGFGIVVGALATMAFIKRTITPLISTPLADLLKDKFSPQTNKTSKNEETVMTPAMIDSTMPKVEQKNNSLKLNA